MVKESIVNVKIASRFHFHIRNLGGTADMGKLFSPNGVNLTTRHFSCNYSEPMMAETPASMSREQVKPVLQVTSQMRFYE